MVEPIEQAERELKDCCQCFSCRESYRKFWKQAQALHEQDLRNELDFLIALYKNYDIPSISDRIKIIREKLA